MSWAKPVSPSLTTKEYDPLPGRTVLTMESPERRMRLALLGASFHVQC